MTLRRLFLRGGSVASVVGIGALAFGALSGPLWGLLAAGVAITAIGFSMVGMVCGGKVKE